MIDGIDLEGLEYVRADLFTNTERALLSICTNYEIVEYKNNKYYRIGSHVYRTPEGGLSTTAAGNTQISSWIYTQIDPVIDASQNVAYSGNCFAAACGTAEKGGWKSGGENYWTRDYQFQLYSGSNSPNVDYDESRVAGLDQIHNALDNLNQPIVVGVDYDPSSDANPNTDKTTDHFITIVGRGSDASGEFFRYYENVGDDTGPELKLYLQGDNTLKTSDDTGGGTSYTFNGQIYTVTQVRPTTE